MTLKQLGAWGRIVVKGKPEEVAGIFYRFLHKAPMAWRNLALEVLCARANAERGWIPFFMKGLLVTDRTRFIGVESTTDGDLDRITEELLDELKGE